MVGVAFLVTCRSYSYFIYFLWLFLYCMYNVLFALGEINILLLLLSPPIPLRLYTLPLNTLSPERQSARMSKIKNGGLHQYGAEPLEQQQFGTAGVEGVNNPHHVLHRVLPAITTAPQRYSS